MDTFFDFNQGTTPIATSAKADGVSPFDVRDEQQQHFSGPSHDYNQYKQTVGLPAGSVANMPQGNFDGYSAGFSNSMPGWSSGVDMDTDMTVDFNDPNSAMPAMFYQPSGNDADGFVNPHTIGGDEPVSHVGRLWPGMHSQQAQQAAMQKAAQSHAVHQRQMKLQSQHAHYRQAAHPAQLASSSKRPSHVSDPHVEQSISRLLNQMRQSSNALSNDDSQGMLPHIARMKKDEEEMDEDERLLASDEGKKLSSKERRQLRNKVSARAFRSRRKEYISQLEGEVAVKAQESHSLRNENAALMQENERYRALIEVVLRHPSFTPFLNDLGQDPSVLGIMQQHGSSAPQPQQPQHRPSATPAQQQPQPQPQQQQQQQQQQPQGQAPQQSEGKPDFLNFDASQLRIPSQSQTEQVGMAMVPENDFSKLNLDGFNNSVNFNNYQSVNAFALTDLPDGPDPADLLLDAPMGLSGDVQYVSNTASSSADMSALLDRLDGAARTLSANVSA